MNKKNLITLTLLIIVPILISLNINSVNATNEKEMLRTANSALNNAFINVLNAENAGANVTELMSRLNAAGTFLAEAENNYHSGNIANVTIQAENSRLIAEQVSIDALTLLEITLVASQNNYWSTLAFSVIGSVVFIVCLLFVWRRFKQTRSENCLK